MVQDRSSDSTTAMPVGSAKSIVLTSPSWLMTTSSLPVV
jgi:hypothetical protein